jgi:hypothetical protein
VQNANISRHCKHLNPPNYKYTAEINFCSLHHADYLTEKTKVFHNKFLSSGRAMRPYYYNNSVALVRERTTPTEGKRFVGEVSANICG